MTYFEQAASNIIKTAQSNGWTIYEALEDFDFDFYGYRNGEPRMLTSQKSAVCEIIMARGFDIHQAAA